MRRLVPSCVTALGLLLGLAGVTLWPKPVALLLLGLSLVCDVLDGWLARQLDAVSRAGGYFDLATDSVLAVAVTIRAIPMQFWPIFLPAFVVLLTWTLSNDTAGVRLSGRAAVTLLACAVALG